MNLLSYSIVLVPIAVIVIGTKYKLYPASLQANALIQWFVYGNYDANNNSHKQQSDQLKDDERLLLDDKEEKSRNQNKRAFNESTSNTTLGILWCLLGLQVSYLIWGFLQEKIMTTEYPVTSASELIESSQQHSIHVDLNETTANKHLMNSGSKSQQHHSQVVTFHDSQFLVFINRIVAFIMAILALIISRQRQSKLYQSDRLITSTNRPQSSSSSPKPQAPLYEYVYCSLSNILSSWCQYEALKYINFPTQCLSKSCKVIPVMLMSRILLHKKYPFMDYFCAFLLASGMFIFMLNQPTNLRHVKQREQKEAAATSHGHLVGGTFISGIVILALYLTFDSFTSNWQQRLYGRYGISNWQMMAAINFYSILLTLTSLHQLGNLKPAIKLLASSSILLRDLMIMSIMSSIGQMFVYYTIKRFGSVVFAVIMTLRQFLSIILSCTIYGHQLDLGSSVGLVLVFLVVGFQVWHKSRQRDANRSARNKTNTDNNVYIQFGPVK